MYSQTEYGWIGISVDSDSLEDTKEVQPSEWYAEWNIPRLSKVNSFLILDEIFHITKTDHKGMKKTICFVYRVSDKRLVTASPHSKEDTIEMVKRKYIEQNTILDSPSLFD